MRARNMNLAISIAVVICFTADAVQNFWDCDNSSEGNGTSCVDITACPKLLDYYNKGSMENNPILEGSLCGFSGTTPKVCCYSNTCITPEGHPGRCVVVESCPQIMALLSLPKPLSLQWAQYIKRSRCEMERPSTRPLDYMVCCGESKPPVDPVSRCDNSMDPAAGCCGRRVFDDSLNPDATETGVDLSPWLALIDYGKNPNGTPKLLCSGALISSQYVLTVAHCLSGPVLKTRLVPMAVRLGEYNSKTEQDCVWLSDITVDCTEPVVVIPIEKTVLHPDYIPAAITTAHDIALVRLAQPVVFTDFIRPICLPSTDVTVNLPKRFGLHAIVFEDVYVGTTRSHVQKEQVYLPYWTVDECQEPYSRLKKPITIHEKHICAGGVDGKDSCGGGGALMYKRDGYFELIGLLSFGPNPCKRNGYPAVFTKVYEYVDWIKSEIKG